MKDAKGHGSDPRGAHTSGIDKIAGPEKLVPIDSVRPRPENTAMIEKLNRLEDKRQASYAAAYPNEPLPPRDGPREHIEQYRKDYLKGDNFPPLAINRKGFIEDGEHRWRAFKAAGATHVKIRVLK